MFLNACYEKEYSKGKYIGYNKSKNEERLKISKKFKKRKCLFMKLLQ